MPPPPTLPNELLEEIFMRLPPDEPAFLVRATLASKHWFGLLTGPAFRSRYRDFHGAPSMLGFFRSWTPYSAWGEEGLEPLFVSTSNFVACIPGKEEDQYDEDVTDTKLAVLDPVTGRWRELCVPKEYDSHGAAVLCAVPGCHHRTCHEGPFRVIVVGMNINKGDSVAYVYVSLPMTDQWSQPPSQWSQPCPGLHLGFDAIFQPMPPVLTEEALYFTLMYDDDDDKRVGILIYDLRSKCLSLIDVPLMETDIACNAILMGMEDGSLGFAHLDGLTLNLWSRKMGSDGTTTWTHLRVINLEELLPIQNLKQRLGLIGSVEGSDIIFMTMDFGICQISLKSLEWKKIWKEEYFGALLPYMSFNDP
ncbi:hypothetical protein QYE76_041209 [Lolium multiflorum]|uniref:F-box domain-containing protein n=1 Tax=Lolium multiflorum TaxID=4521 RepID=A0AAD8TDD1_LOLMU|nr:hypothetical protein QYE76_041209 [Lolium multiflorum]